MLYVILMALFLIAWFVMDFLAMREDRRRNRRR